MVTPVLPKPTAAIVDGAGYSRTEWYDFFRKLLEFVGDNSGVAAEIQAILVRLAALEDDHSLNFVINGSQSIRVAGTPASGAVTIRLFDGDEIGDTITWEGGDWVSGPYFSRIKIVTGGLITPIVPVDADRGKTFVFTNGGGGPVSFEVPVSTTLEFPIGTIFLLYNNRSVGSVNITGEVGVTFDQPTGVGLQITDRYQQAVLKQVSLDHWTLSGQVIGAIPIYQFIQLIDAPSSYSGQALKFTRVNAGETGLEFVSAPGGVASVNDGAGIDVDNTDPANPIVNLDWASIASLALADSAVQSVVAGTNITVDNTDPQNPVVNASGGGGSGDVVGPASSVNNHVVFFDGATGKLIKDSGLTLAGTNTGDQTLAGLGGQPLDAALTDLSGITFVQGDVVYFDGANLVRLAAGTAGYVLQSTGPGANPVYGPVGAGSATAIQVDVYATPGSTTWNKPAGAKFIEVVAFGGGGGGGGAAKRSGSNNSGPGGGGGGARAIQKFNASDVGGSETVVTGAGGPGGAGQTTDLGTVGTAGGNSSFGTLVVAYGGGAGAGGTGGGTCSGGGGGGVRGAGGNAASPAGIGAAGAGGGSASQSSASAAALVENVTYWGGGAGVASPANAVGMVGGSALGGGAGGGGGTGGLTQFAGGAGGAGYQGVAVGAGGTASGGAGGNGATPTSIYGAGSGGGGGATTNVAGQNGGDGGNGGRASGGGGGGTCSGTGTRGGNGGNGGNGFVAVITYF